MNTAAGSLTLKSGASLTTPAFSNAGAVQIEGNSKFAPSSYTQIAGATTLSGGGTLGAPLPASPINLNLLGGTLVGSGTLNANLTNAATVAPGASPGSLTVRGNYVQSAAGNLNIEIGGITPGSGYDQLNVSGTAVLNGVLNVSLVNGFGTSLGQTFDVVSYSAHNGEFAAYTGLRSRRFELFEPVVEATRVRLNALSTQGDLAFQSFDSATFPTSATSGKIVPLKYTIKNLSDAPLDDDWVDSLYLSRDGVLDPSDALLARVDHKGGVGGNASYTETVAAAVPPLVDGAYRVIVLTDSRGLAPDSDRGNNMGVSAQAISVSVPLLTLGTPVTGSLAPGQDVYYRLLVAPGQDVTFRADFTVPLQADFFLRSGDLPDQSNFDQSATSVELHPRLMLSNPQGGSYYILLHGRDGAVGGTPFTLGAESSKFEVVRLNPLRGSNKGDATIDLLGSKFTPQTRVSLLRVDGVTHDATSVDFIDSSHLSVTFNLQGVIIGSYQMQAKDAGQTSVSADAFLVTDIAPGQLHIEMTSPAFVRVGGKIMVTLNVDNPSDSNVAVPLLLLGATNVTPDAAKQEFFGGPLLPKILPPHYHGSVAIEPYTPVPKANGVVSDFKLSVINPTEVAINWDAQKASLRPKSIPADAWDAIWANLRPQLGDTLEDFYALLSGDFRALGRWPGLEVRHVARLFAFELRMANDLPALPVPAGGLDLAFPAPGLPLAFGRSFGASIAARYYVGRLGRGWVDNLDISASADPDTGLVTIRQGGSLRLFARMPDGSYMGVPGDFATLTMAGGAFLLRETGGAVMGFRTDGQLDYLQDTNNNRLTARYSGSQLTSLTHTNGSAMTFHYNAQGRIDQATDPAGRVATYAYDASGEHLLSVTTTAGTIAYAYTPEASGPRANAITSISYPDGTHLFFDYDNRGRLVSQKQDGGANAISFTYDIAIYRVTDALGDSTYVIYDDLGRTALRIDGVGPNVGDEGPVTRMAYDDLTGRLGQVVPPGSNPVTFGYDGRGNQTQITDPQGQTQKFSYEPSPNRLVSWKDALDNETKYDHDPNGNLSSTTYVDGTSEQFSYDVQGRPSECGQSSGPVF